MIKRCIHRLFLLMPLVLLISCANSQQKTAQVEVLYNDCKEPRSEICTREYRPVCATRDTGVRCVTTPCPATEIKTYSNACTACSDPKVLGYRVGSCEVIPQ